MTDRAAILRFDHIVLAELLHLPEGSHIDAVCMNVEQPGVLLMRVRGVGEPVAPGQWIAPLIPVITTRQLDDGTRFVESVDWGLPG